MKLPKRRQMRLQGYEYSENNAYFITICTHIRAHIFGEMVGAHLCVRPNEPDKMIEKWLFEIENKYENVTIDKYVIMPDHIHFILFNIGKDTQTGAHIGAPLQEIIKWFKTQTTNEYIKNVKNGLYSPFDKHIWQRSYYDHVIRNEDDLHEIRKYIEENPLKWQVDKLYE